MFPFATPFEQVVLEPASRFFWFWDFGRGQRRHKPPALPSVHKKQGQLNWQKRGTEKRFSVVRIKSESRIIEVMLIFKQR